MHVLDIDRVIIAAPDLTEATEQFAELGLTFSPPKPAETDSPAGLQRMRLAYAEPGVEVIVPVDEDNEVARFIQENGPGIYGFVFRVDDLDAAVADLAERGIEPIAEEGSEAAPEAFYHPKDFSGTFTILTEYDHPMLAD